jgi:hypothetical protein
MAYDIRKLKIFKKEKKEHPSFTDEQVMQIVKNHLKQEEIKNNKIKTVIKELEKYYFECREDEDWFPKSSIVSVLYNLMEKKRLYIKNGL